MHLTTHDLGDDGTCVDCHLLSCPVLAGYVVVSDGARFLRMDMGVIDHNAHVEFTPCWLLTQHGRESRD